MGAGNTLMSAGNTLTGAGNTSMSIGNVREGARNALVIGHGFEAIETKL